MIVEQIWTGNAYRNFNYLIACPETGEALAIDPLDHEKCLDAARRRAAGRSPRSSTPTSTATTPAATARWSPRPARRCSRTRTRKDRIAGIDRGLAAGDVVKVGKTRRARSAGHAGPHDVPRVPAVAHRPPALFCGDTLFNAGAGNCHNGGHPEELYKTFAEQLAKLPDATRIYPGHDYIENNLRFTLDREPDNARAASCSTEIRKDQDPSHARGHDARRSRSEINTFFRLTSPSVIARLREAFPDLPRRSPTARRCS